MFEKLFKITKLLPTKSISIASYAKKCVDNMSGDTERHACPIVRKFIHKTVRGGRVCALI